MQAIAATAQAVTEEELTLRIGAVMKHLMTATGRDFFAELERLDLGISQIKALNALADSGEPLSVKALSEELGMSLAGVSRSVDGLCKRGFLTREEDPADRRSKRLGLTAKGRRTVEGLIELRLAGVRKWVERLGPEERQALAQGLEPIAQRAEIASQLKKGGRAR